MIAEGSEDLFKDMNMSNNSQTTNSLFGGVKNVEIEKRNMPEKGDAEEGGWGEELDIDLS